MEIAFFFALIIVCFVATVSGGVSIASYVDDREELYPALKVFCVFFLLAVGGFSIIGWYSQYDYSGETTEFKSATVQGVDVIVVDGDVINLNQRFSRDFEEGTVITRTPNDADLGWFRGSSIPEYKVKENE